jgi:hypothetical protein
MYLRWSCHVPGPPVKRHDLRLSGQASALSYARGTRQVQGRYIARGDVSRATTRTRSPSARRAATPPRRQLRNKLKPATALRISWPAGSSFGTPRPLRSVTSTRTTPPPVLTATVTVSPGAAEPLRRILLPKSSLTRSSASFPHGCPGPGTPPTNARASRARSAPGKRHVSRTATSAISAPPSRPRSSREPCGPSCGHTGCARLSGARQAGYAIGAARPWPSVENQRLHRPRNRHGRRPPYVRGHRNMTVYSATR